MKRRVIISILLFVISSFFFLNNTISAYTDANSFNVNLSVEGCNFNGTCETGENLLSCPSDCTVVPPLPPTPGKGGGRIMPVSIADLSVQAYFTNAFINWKTSVGAISTIRWGETTETKEGSLRSVIFDVSHRMEIINLKPGTMYFYSIESQNINGVVSLYGPVFFFTKFLKDTSFPLSPLNVRATTDVNGVTISWTNPPDSNFAYVRIMRNEDRFLGDPFMGKLIYEGNGEKFLDKNVTPGKKYFYVLFARDVNQNFSGGVGVSVVAFSPTKISIPLPTKTPPFIKEIPIPLAIDFFVHQYNQQVEKLTNTKTITIDNDKSTIIDTNTKTSPGDWAEVSNQEGIIIGRYLFSFNKDSNRYQSVIPPLTKGENFYVKIYRYKENIPDTIGEGTLYIRDNILPKTKEIGGYSYILYFIIFISLFFLLLLLLLLIKRRRKTEQNKAFNNTNIEK